MLLILFLTACQTPPPTQAPKADKTCPHLDTTPGQVVRYGRYTLVELVPEQGQRDLLAQVIDVTIPLSQGMNEATVGEAIRYVLLRSGYQLRDISSSSTLDKLPLPLAHTHLGPIQLRDALLVLAGPAWELKIDEMTRQIWFVSRFNNLRVKNEKTEIEQ